MNKFIYSDSKLKVEIPIICGITLIHGDSGTGKSYLCNRIRKAQAEPSIRKSTNSNVELQRICVIQNRMELPALYQQTGKLIFIDKLDLLVLKEVSDSKYIQDEELINYINTSQNYFILMSRGRTSGIKTLGSAIFQFRIIEDRGRQKMEVYR